MAMRPASRGSTAPPRIGSPEPRGWRVRPQAVLRRHPRRTIRVAFGDRRGRLAKRRVVPSAYSTAGRVSVGRRSRKTRRRSRTAGKRPCPNARVAPPRPGEASMDRREGDEHGAPEHERRQVAGRPNDDARADRGWGKDRLAGRIAPHPPGGASPQALLW